MITPEEITPGEGVTPESRKKRQSGNSHLVRCDLNVTGDYLFFQEATRETQGLSLEAREKVAASLLVSYILGASTIYEVKEGRERGGTCNKSTKSTKIMLKYAIRASVDALCRDDTGQISHDPGKKCV